MAIQYVNVVRIVMKFLCGKGVVTFAKALSAVDEKEIRLKVSKFSKAKLFNGVYIKDCLPHSVA